MSKLFCANCGTVLEEDSKYCYRCGTQAGIHKPKEFMKPKEFGAQKQENNISSYKSNIQIIAILEAANGIITLLITLVLGVVLINIPKIMNYVDVQDPEFWRIWPIASSFLWILLIILVIYGVLNILLGVSLYRFKSFGRIGTMINGGLGILNVPIGTIFGIASIYLLTRPEAEVVFN
ncbi:MAG: zinc-ribbon domain-containing protein [Candidatus Hodarchaeales archaeon]|jgi:hypothetical protein